MQAIDAAPTLGRMKITAQYTRVMKKFGKELRAARLRAGWPSAQKFAEHLGIEPPAYRKYERGEASPNLETITRLCSRLNVTPNDLLPEAASQRRPLSQIVPVS